MNSLSIITLSIVLLLVGGLTAITLRMNNQKNRLTAELDTLRQDFRALCAGAVGVDKRVFRLEQRGRDLLQRLENFELRYDNPARPYGEAIHSVQKGASADRLIEEYGLTENEAELIVMLHGIKDSEGCI